MTLVSFDSVLSHPISWCDPALSAHHGRVLHKHLSWSTLVPICLPNPQPCLRSSKLEIIRIWD